MAHPILIPVNDLREAAVAIEAVEAFRHGRAPASVKALDTDQPHMPMAERLKAALEVIPINPVKEAVLKALLAAPDNAWIPYPQMVKAVISAGAATAKDGAGRSQAALRDLSWQVKETAAPADLAGVQKPIELLANRTRTAGVYQYRLTAAGRLAAQAFFDGQRIA